ncbi:MAG: fasciclin domain-containing protein, partial [Myxococcota bacterium]
ATEPTGDDDATEPTGDDDATEPTGDDDAGPSDDDTTEPGDDDVVEPPASTFCDDYVATCGDWPVAETSCADWWAAAAEGTEGDSTGATQACYTYHLDVAASMTEQADIDMHCAHALGMADMNGMAPCIGNIIEVAGANGSFGLLAAAVEAAGLTETLSTGEYTVFAPTDAAITTALETLGLSVEEFVGDADLLNSVLTYHVVAGTVLASEVVTMTSATTLQGSDIMIEVVDGAVVLNGSVNVTATDVMASNGVIHVIDAVLMPPAAESNFCDDYVATCGEWPVAETSCADWWAAAPAGEAGAATGASQACYTYHLDVAASMTEQADIDMHCAHALGMADMSGNAPCLGNIIEVASGAGFNLLTAAVAAGQLTETLSTGEYTVFAPTDAAITTALETLGLSVEEFVGDADLLNSVLTYHVVAGTVLASDVVTMTSATTLQGSDIMIEVVDGAVVLNGSVNVTATDVMASNGIIHVIDAVLLPPAAPETTFCDDYVATCGEWPVAETSCADWWAAAEMGTEGDTTGATQACYTYHLGVAASMTEQADIDMHCAHALGMADMNDFAPCTAE